MILPNAINPVLDSLPSVVSLRAQIAEAILQREGLIVLTGTSGTGKTTLAETALDALASTPTFQSRIAGSPQTFEDLVGQILVDFGATSAEALGGRSLEQISGHDRVLLLNRFLVAMPSSSRAIVIV